MLLSPAGKMSIDEPNCQTDRAISVHNAVPGLPIHDVLDSMPIRPSAELTSPWSPNTCDQRIDTATLPSIRDGR